MKFRSTNAWLIVLVMMAGGLGAVGSGRAQDPFEKEVRAQQQLKQKQQQLQKSEAALAAKSFSEVRVRTSLAESIRRAAEAVRDADGEEAKAAAQKNLTDLLGQFFDEDMVRREQELAQIEVRLVKLRELLDRRRTKKQEILELQSKVALNEAEGLGFYNSERSGGGKGGATYGMGGGGGSLFGRAFEVDREAPEIIEVPVPTVVTVPSNPFAAPAAAPVSPPVPTSPQSPASR